MTSSQSESAVSSMAATTALSTTPSSTSPTQTTPSSLARTPLSTLDAERRALRERLERLRAHTAVHVVASYNHGGTWPCVKLPT
eukprot:2563688-Pleurochrysis_carterae.AAC.1